MREKQLLRGPRGRKVRRYLKRHPESYIEVLLPNPDGKLGIAIFGPPIFNNKPQSIDVASGGDWAGIPTPSTAEMQPTPKDSSDQSFFNEEYTYLDAVIAAEPYACKTCGAINDDPCMTKSGKIASKEHVGRTVL